MKSKLLKRFEDEIQALDRELKHDLPKEIQKAREHGDLRENAEYQAAKERQRLVESQISLLQKRRKNSLQSSSCVVSFLNALCSITVCIKYTTSCSLLLTCKVFL